MPASVDAQPDAPFRIWIDIAPAGEFRIVVPGRGQSGKVSVRTVVAQESSEAGAATVARETVAQIVGESVRALRAGPATPEPTSVPVSAPERAPEPPTLAGVAHPASVVPPSPKARRFEVTLAAGAHTAPFKMAEPSSESNWLGPLVQGQVRWRIGKAALAMRAGWEKSDKTIDSLWLYTQFYRMTVAAFRRFQLDSLDLGIGFELGALYIRQSTEANYAYTSVYPTEFSPGTLRNTESLGYLFGPVAEANLRLTERWFFHIDFAASIDNVKMKAGSLGATTAWESSPSIRGTLGLGVRI
jgi:hypothetical protein